MHPKSKDFLKLQKEWDKRLKKSGFDDIEQRDGNLKIWDSHYFKVRYRENFSEAKTEYYRRAGQFLYEYKFDSPLERQIWALHSEGMSLRNIAKEVSKGKNKHNKDGINHIVRRLTAEMFKLYRNYE